MMSTGRPLTGRPLTAGRRLLGCQCPQRRRDPKFFFVPTAQDPTWALKFPTMASHATMQQVPKSGILSLPEAARGPTADF